MKDPSSLRGQILRFLVVGGIATAIDLVFYVSFIRWLGLSPSWAKRWSFMVGSVWAFFMNKHYTFKQKKAYKKQPFMFACVYGIGWVVNSHGHDAVLSLWNIQPLAYVVGTALSTVTHFILQKYFVFRDATSHGRP